MSYNLELKYSCKDHSTLNLFVIATHLNLCYAYNPQRDFSWVNNNKLIYGCPLISMNISWVALLDKNHPHILVILFDNFLSAFANWVLSIVTKISFLP